MTLHRSAGAGARLALDASGGDLAPLSNVEGAKAFVREYPDSTVVLVGDVDQLAPLVGAQGRGIELVHAPERVEMGEHPSQAVRRKRRSSIRRCFELVSEGKADAVVSAGNSGAVMTAALLVLGRLRGVERPAFAALLPSLRSGGRGGGCLLLDAGANTRCRPSQLAQFAVMGDVYARKVMKVASPRVAVLSNGEEAEKGTELTRDALELLRHSGLNLLGYVEGKDIFSGDVDVVVTDGFTGNVVLKTSEGTASAMAGLLRSAVERAGLSEKLGALLLGPTLTGLKKVVDYAEYGGAPLLGFAGVGIVAHGRSSGKAIKNALRVARETGEAGLQGELERAIVESRRWLRPDSAERT